MLKKGDKVYCIRNEIGLNITIGKSYKLKDIADKADKYYSNNACFYITNDKGITLGYYKYRFVSLCGYRRLKLDKISGSVAL